MSVLRHNSIRVMRRERERLAQLLHDPRRVGLVGHVGAGDRLAPCWLPRSSSPIHDRATGKLEHTLVFDSINVAMLM